MRTASPIVCLALLAALAGGCASAGATAPARPPLIVNLTAGPEDLHSAFMALAFASFAVEDRPVTVFLNVRAPALASLRTPAATGMAGKPTVREQIASLVKAGAKIVVCPTCAGLLGVTGEDLLPGVEFATRESLFGPLDAGAAVMSY
jgi:predicted peroxiredoxin